MSNTIDRHYNDFGGLDSRSNQMLQPSTTCRDGSLNFQFRTDGANSDFDVLSKRRGFQDKSSSLNAAELGLIEYKYKDLNTGASKVQILGAGADGKLRKRTEHRFKITKSGGSVTSYSLFFDTTSSLYKFEFLDSSNTILSSYAFNTSLTLNALKVALNALAITGLTFDVVDENGASFVSSAVLAYLLDVKYREELLNADSAFNVAYDWVVVPSPKANGVMFEYIASGAWQNNSEFEGVSYINLNNACYMTDGGFPLKYDGFSVYRAGIPRTIGTIATNFPKTYSPDGTLLLDNVTVTGSQIVAGGVYTYKFQYGHVDASGVEILGKTNNFLQIQAGATLGSAINIRTGYITGQDFPAYGARSSANQAIGVSNKVISVYTGHNVLPGMYLRIGFKNDGVGYGYSFIYMLVESVTATSITLKDLPGRILLYPFNITPINDDTFLNNQWIQAGYSFEDLNLRTTDVDETVVPVIASNFLPEIKLGAFIRVYRTKVNVPDGPFYRLVDLPLPLDLTQNFIDIYGDTSLTRSYLSSELLDPSEGEELPRACKYLSKFQNQLVQAGRPYNGQLAGAWYPTNVEQAAFENAWGDESLQLTISKYTEAHLCDFQSVYWSDTLNQEGFPQSGLNEESFDTKFNDQVKGIGENKDSLFVFKERSMGYLSGTLATGDIQKEILESDLGCAAHASIQEVQGSLVWLDKNYGFCSVIAGRLPEIIGFTIQDKQKKNNFLSRLTKFRFSGAKAVNHRIDDVYICYIPGGTNDPDNTTAVPSPTASSRMFVFDYSQGASALRKCWYEWSGVDAAGGLLSQNDVLFVTSSNGKSLQAKKTGSIYDFSDNSSPINFVYKGAWLTYGLMSIDKRFINLAINSVKRGFSLLVSQYYNFTDTKVGEILINFAAGSTNSPRLTVALNKQKVVSGSIGFENNVIYEDVSINGWDIQYSPEYDSGEAKK